ncbi:hypothetical protein CPC08DRAFT_595223, partial [Agrocybe pediades]
VLCELVKWRHDWWARHWMDDWPSYGPDSLVTDTDLEEIATRILTVYTGEHLRRYTRIVHIHDLSQPLLSALHEIRARICGIQVDESDTSAEANPISNSQLTTPH